MADLLVRYGAKPSGYVPQGEDAFVNAALRLDETAVRRILAEQPEYLTTPKALFEAARRNRADVVRMLLDLGTPIEIEGRSTGRALHEAAYHNALDVARLLIERGAEIDPVEHSWATRPWTSRDTRSTRK